MEFLTDAYEIRETANGPTQVDWRILSNAHEVRFWHYRP
jgi:hypothetical protein